MAEEIRTPDCGGAHCKLDHGEVRVLPTGSESNEILCYHCYANEMRYRVARNKTVEEFAQFDIPLWNNLKIYKDNW